MKITWLKLFFLLLFLALLAVPPVKEKTPTPAGRMAFTTAHWIPVWVALQPPQGEEEEGEPTGGVTVGALLSDLNLAVLVPEVAILFFLGYLVGRIRKKGKGKKGR